MSKIDQCTAVILAGGESRRMGQDKASTVFKGQTLLTHLEQRLTPLFKHVVVSVREQRSDTHLHQVLDQSESRAPMFGIVAALQAVDTSWVFVVGVDMPLLVPELVENMANQCDNWDAVAVFMDGIPQPLCCFYHQSCLSSMQEHLAAGKRSLKYFLNDMNTQLMTEHDARIHDGQLQSFISLDTRDKLNFHQGKH